MRSPGTSKSISTREHPPEISPLQFAAIKRKAAPFRGIRPRHFHPSLGEAGTQEVPPASQNVSREGAYTDPEGEQVTLMVWGPILFPWLPSCQLPPICVLSRLITACLLLVAGLGGLLYGVDVGIIGGALPYLEATSGLNASQLSIIVAAVLLGSVISTLFAGLLADWLGRKPLMVISGAIFVLSIPVIALSHGFGPLFLGRLLQGVSGGSWASSSRSTWRSACQPRIGERHRSLPVAADPGYFLRRGDRHLLQLSGRRPDQLKLAGRPAERQRPGMAAHLLDVDAARYFVPGRQPVRRRVTPMALPARPQAASPGRPAAIANQ